MTDSPSGAGNLSQLLEELARIPRTPVPDRHFEGLAPGTRVGRFVVRREIGRGGFGVVYAAQDAELGREVALKVLRPGIALARGETEWIRAEAEAVARLNHPAIVTIFEAGRSERGAYLIFELLHGEGLDARLARGEMTLEEVIRIAIAVASALEQAHGAGVLHRDLKPANVFICEGGAVKVFDFGIAQLFDRDPAPGAGTPGYMAPEQREGRPQDARSDLFSLGVLIRDMLAACTAGDGARRSTRRAIALRRLCEDLTQPDPGRRPASAQDVRSRLEAIRRDRDSIIRRIALPVLAAITVAVAVWGVVEALQPKEAPPGERVVVALSSAQNESGLAELDHLADLVRIALTDSRRIAVVAQPRMEAAIRGLGTTPAAASSEDWRTAAARLGATMVVDLKARRDGAELGIEFTSRDTGTGRVRFQDTATASSLEALPRELDGVIRSFRRESGERRSDLRRDSGSLGELATSSLVAFRQYVLGVMCMEAVPEMGDRESAGRCGEHLRRALEADPSFALAHRDLGVALSTADPRSEEARSQLDASLSVPGRLSRRDEALARAWRDRLAGDDAAALGRYAALVAEDPWDVLARFKAGDLLFHVSRYDEAIPYLEQLVSVDAPHPWALSHLVESYALAGRRSDLAKLMDGIETPGAAQVRDVVRGEGWLGRHTRAVRIARAWEERLPGTTGSLILLQALTAAGQFQEAESVAAAISTRDPGNCPAFIYRVLLAAERGQSTQAWRLVGLPPKDLDCPSDFNPALLKAAIAAGDRKIHRMRAEVQKAPDGARSPPTLVATQLALLGTVEDAKAMRETVPAGTTAAVEIAALEAWKAGDASRAGAMLAALERKSPRPSDALPPAYLLAEVTREEDPSEALAAAARFRSGMPIGPTGGWTYGRSLLVSAEAAWRLGLQREAMEFLDDTDDLLSGADPGFPLSVEAARLRKAVES
ncbi:MAG: hypothetical protein RJA59_2009, partial [Pseudomonadota bacterium]